MYSDGDELSVVYCTDKFSFVLWPWFCISPFLVTYNQRKTQTLKRNNMCITCIAYIHFKQVKWNHENYRKIKNMGPCLDRWTLINVSKAFSLCTVRDDPTWWNLYICQLKVESVIVNNGNTDHHFTVPKTIPDCSTLAIWSHFLCRWWVLVFIGLSYERPYLVLDLNLIGK